MMPSLAAWALLDLGVPTCARGILILSGFILSDTLGLTR